MPILYYGNEEQRQKYVIAPCNRWTNRSLCLPNLVLVAMLTQEKTTAKLSDDGKYYITEWQKMWITNAGFADTQVCLPGWKRPRG